MFIFCIALVIGVFTGCLVTGFFMSRPQEREVVEVDVRKNLPVDDWVTFEWIYFHTELSPKDLQTLRHVLELYTEEGVVEVKKEGKVLMYRLNTNTST